LNLNEFARQLGIEVYGELDSRTLVPQERIRAYCRENKCGNYGNNYMCPPHVGSINILRGKLKSYRKGILLRYSQDIDVINDREGVMRTQKEFHQKILRLEDYLRKRGNREVWGLIGGNCGLCQVCQARTGQPCSDPLNARMSLEAIGIDVQALLERLGLDSRFQAHKIYWTGCILTA
jgi:predicted metal-binding protein